MKKQIILLSIIVISQISVTSAQNKNTDDPDYKRSTAGFVRFYPLELLMHEFRMGVELATAPKQAIVLDGSYFWGERSVGSGSQRQGWAIKMDYRFYLANVSKKSRFFFGPNLMVKQQAYVKDYDVFSNTYATSINGSRQVYCVNMKMGADFWLSRNNRARFELFYGVGVRYQSPGKNFFERGSVDASASKVLPNLMLGVALKL